MANGDGDGAGHAGQNGVDGASAHAAEREGDAKPKPGGDDVLEQGLECTYTDAQSGQTCTVTILKVHHDDPPPYYSIRMPDGNERETVRERLSRQTGPVATPPKGAAADAPPLLTMVEIFKRQLGLDSKLNMQEAVTST